MAKESMKAREVKRAKLVARYAEKREALKKIIATSNDPAEAYEAARKLQAIPGVVSTETLISLEQSIKREIPVLLDED